MLWIHAVLLTHVALAAQSADGPVTIRAQSGLAGLEAARQRVREALATGSPPSVIVLLPGQTIQLDAPLEFGPADGHPGSGTVTWRAEPDAETILSGARTISWREEPDGTWSAPSPVRRVRQLFVGSEIRPRARLPEVGWLQLEAAGPDGRSHAVFRRGDLNAGAPLGDAEFVLLHDWSMSRVGIASIDSPTRQIRFSHPVGAWHSFFTITNWEAHPRYAIEGVLAGWDRPGEWICDDRLRYRPRTGESADSIEALVPHLDTLVTVEGSRGLRFEGITFQHTRGVDLTRGYAGVQAAFCQDRSGEKDLRELYPSPCGVRLSGAQNCEFVRCRFQHLGGSAVWFAEGCRGGGIRSCHIESVGANGVMIGATDEPEAASQLTRNVSVLDSSIKRCGTVCYGAVGAWIGIAADITVSHNAVHDLPYTGISLGWIWSPRPSPSRGHRVEHNHIHHVMQLLSDGGGIYTLGRQPDTVLRANLIHDVPLNRGRAESNGYFVDQGSCQMVIEDNVIYSVARAPIRFHMAGANTVRNNTLVAGEGVAPFTFNSATPESMTITGNRLPDAVSFQAPNARDFGAGPRKRF